MYLREWLKICFYFVRCLIGLGDKLQHFYWLSVSFRKFCAIKRYHLKAWEITFAPFFQHFSSSFENTCPRKVQVYVRVHRLALIVVQFGLVKVLIYWGLSQKCCHSVPTLVCPILVKFGQRHFHETSGSFWSNGLREDHIVLCGCMTSGYVCLRV